MATLLLILIYIAFISLGLPDAILGSAWPVLHQELGVSVSWAGILSTIVSAGTIVSSFFSGKLIEKFGTGRVTAVSVAMTAAGLWGYCLSPGFFWLCLLAVPLGVGAGAVDSALNNFVALHYEAAHMNWLHCFWGIGATAGPLLMSLFLTKESGWRMGYGTIAAMQCVLVVCLAASLPLWKRFETRQQEQAEGGEKRSAGLAELLRLPGAKPALLSFFAYCSVEAATGLWSSTFLVQQKGLTAETAARWVSLFYLGITVGRGLAGIFALRFNNKQMIRMGGCLCLAGCVLLVMPGAAWMSLADLRRLRLCTHLSCDAARYAEPLRQGHQPEHHGDPDGDRICGVSFNAAVFGISRKDVRLWDPSVFPADAGSADACHERTGKPGIGKTLRSLIQTGALAGEPPSAGCLRGIRF